MCQCQCQEHWELQRRLQCLPRCLANIACQRTSYRLSRLPLRNFATKDADDELSMHDHHKTLGMCRGILRPQAARILSPVVRISFVQGRICFVLSLRLLIREVRPMGGGCKDILIIHMYSLSKHARTEIGAQPARIFVRINDAKS